MSLLDTASLIVTPNGVKEGKLYSVIPSDGSGDMSVTRATTATRVNSAGLVELVPYNLLQYSEQFNNAAWDFLNVATITPNSTTAPNGTTTADTITFTASTASCVAQSVSSPQGSTTLSVYAKVASGTKQFRLRIDAAGGNSSSNFTATTEWQRFEFNVTTSVAGTNFYVINSDTATAGSLFIWGAQLVEGSVAKDYQKTETRLNIPRLDYSNGTCPSLLVEPQRTNLLTYSSSFDNAAWGKVQSSVTANAATSPDGTANADKFIANTTSNIHFSNNSIPNTAAPWTYSLFAKADGYDRLIMWVASTNFVGFNLTTGIVESTLGTGITSANIEDYGNGWFRCSITSTSTASGTSAAFAVFDTNFTNGNANPIFTGNGTDGILIYGAQFEAGNYQTSYIPTTSASVTRNADVISKTGISSLIGQTEGTMYVDYNYEAKPDTNGNIPMVIYSGTNEAYIFILGNGTLLCELYNAGVLQGSIAGSAGGVGRKKIAFAYKQNSFAVYLNGNLIGTDTNGSVGAMSNLFIGGYYAINYSANGGINASALWKTRLTNAQLATLTTI